MNLLLTPMLALLAAAPAQDRPPRFVPPTTRPTELHGPDGQAPRPGVLPEGTTQDAREAWAKVCQATLVPGVARRPVTAFDLEFDVRMTTTAVQENNGRVRFSFLAPNCLRSTISASGRGHLRGPDGDYLIDGKRPIKLVGSRESKDDKRQIEEMIAIARNFLALTDPSGLRILSLERLAGPPATLPAKARGHAKGLIWLDLLSPDFRLLATRDAAPHAPGLFRVQLGIRHSGRVDYALIVEDRGPKTYVEKALLVEMKTYEALDGYMVPRQILVHQIDPASRPLAFAAEPYADLYRVIGTGGLQPDLTPESFLP